MRITNKENNIIISDMIPCDTIDGNNMSFMFIGTCTKRPDELCIGTTAGTYSIKVDPIIDLIKAALEK